MADLFKVFDQVDENIRMLCIDSVFVGCYLYKQGKKQAAEKLISTSLAAASIDNPNLITAIFSDIKKAMETCRAHQELQSLNTD